VVVVVVVKPLVGELSGCGLNMFGNAVCTAFPKNLIFLFFAKI
jgi:hypothetical protein